MQEGKMKKYMKYFKLINGITDKWVGIDHENSKGLYNE